MGLSLNVSLLVALTISSFSAFGQIASTLNILVTSHGARCDGFTDDTAAIQKAADAVPASGANLIFPTKKTCLIKATIFIKSRTNVLGKTSKLKGGIPWRSGPENRYALMENKTSYDMFTNHAGTGPARIDQHFEIRGMTFDYGDFSQGVLNGGKHALRFQFAKNILIIGNTFRGGEDGVAGVGVANMRVEGNSAYDFVNCAYDFWYGPENVELINNFAQTASSAQMVNFNPDRTVANGVHMVARNFIMRGNTLRALGQTGIPIQIEPLAERGTVENVTITGNTLENAFLVLRSDVRRVKISDNIIKNLRPQSAVFIHPWYGATPDSVLFYNNRLVNVQIQADYLGVIRIEAIKSLIHNNSIQQSNTPQIYVGSYPVSQVGNNSSGILQPLLNAKVFDPFFYLESHGDLIGAFGSGNYASAMQHWLTQGGPIEGRQGSLTFSVREYLSLYPYVAPANSSQRYTLAMQHFVSTGSSQGLAGRFALQSVVFDPLLYLNRYSDLRDAFGPLLELSTWHWLTTGIYEGRLGR